jgi:hypothetical protein
LAAISETGFLGRSGLTFKYDNFVTGFLKKPGGGSANDACAQYDDFHGLFP